VNVAGAALTIRDGEDRKRDGDRGSLGLADPWPGSRTQIFTDVTK
jgi:hypothetical protein